MSLTYLSLWYQDDIVRDENMQQGKDIAGPHKDIEGKQRGLEVKA